MKFNWALLKKNPFDFVIVLFWIGLTAFMLYHAVFEQRFGIPGIALSLFLGKYIFWDMSKDYITKEG